MTKTAIDFSLLTPIGKIESNISNGVLNMTTTHAIHDVGYNIRRDKIKSYMQLPGQYRLPIRIDIRFCIDTPEMLLLIGDGHISFGSPWMENRRIEDIVEPAGKPKNYDNSISYNHYVDISVILNFKEMQILINGEERYFSTKERYMKSKYFNEQNASGFNIGITCTKRAELSIQSIIITEYEGIAPFDHHAIALPKSKDKDIPPVKPTFDSCIKNLPIIIKDEIIATERFLKSLENLKFKE